jgi:hypothetical protein
MKHFIKRYLLPWSGCFKAHRAGKHSPIRTEETAACRQCWTTGVIASWRKLKSAKKLLTGRQKCL